MRAAHLGVGAAPVPSRTEHETNACLPDSRLPAPDPVRGRVASTPGPDAGAPGRSTRRKHLPSPLDGGGHPWPPPASRLLPGPLLFQAHLPCRCHSRLWVPSPGRGSSSRSLVSLPLSQFEGKETKSFPLEIKYSLLRCLAPRHQKAGEMLTRPRAMHGLWPGWPAAVRLLFCSRVFLVPVSSVRSCLLEPHCPRLPPLVLKLSGST